MSVELLNRFFQMETEGGLFNLEKEEDLPLWDILRLHIYFKYYYPPKELDKLFKLPRRKWKDYLSLGLDLLNMPVYFLTRPGRNVFLTTSRGLNSDNKYFDKSAIPFLLELGHNCFIIETNLREQTQYKTYNAFISVFKIFFKLKDLSKSAFLKISEVLTQSLGESRVTYHDLNTVYKSVQADYIYYKWLFKVKNTRRLFISRGNEKGAVMAAKKLGVLTFELQHASIEFDNILYTYPASISCINNIAFPEYLLTYGDYWGSNMNIPCKNIISIGNDILFKRNDTACDNSVLIISTIIHGEELSRLTLKMAQENPSLNFVYKLHINEYKIVNYYNNLFSAHGNIRIVQNEEDVSSLISKSQLVVLIISTVLYEALNQNKKVAVYKKMNYDSQSGVFGHSNVYLFDESTELKRILSERIYPSTINFFKPSDKIVIQSVFELGG
ncbi:hypothetical protein GZH53_18295 [Flavihumibacter sp. R14]|nr:hypothetical protein [Flavihumibacter soli]